MADVQTFIPEVINAHFDEAAYLYSEFQVEVKAPEPDSVYLKGVVARIDANLEGLTINAAAAAKHCDAALEGEDAGEFFVAAYLAFQTGDLEKIKPLAEAAQVSTLLLEAFACGLAWHPWDLSGFWATKFISAKQTAMAAVGLFCFNMYKKPLPIRFDDLLIRSLSEKNAPELPLLLSIARKNNDVTILPILQQQSASEVLDDTQFQQLKTRLKLGDQSALLHLKAFVLSDNDHREQALELTFSKLQTNEAKQWMGELKNTLDAERYLLLAVGAMNEKPLLPWVVKQMQVPELARIAGKVFSQLSGQDLRKNEWIITDDKMDEQWLALEGDEELDWPNVEKIKQAIRL
ncbi:MAG: hypothetical protein ACJAWS_001895 [Oleiphilaceae bacterium]|jgi:uncharacterized protein (TIGR02270 family)